MSVRLLLVAGAQPHQADESLVLLRDYLHANAPWRCQVLAWPSRHAGAPPASLDDGDGVVLFASRLGIAGEELERFRRLCREGRPVVAVHTASPAFRHWPAFDDEILGVRLGRRARGQREDGDEVSGGYGREDGGGAIRVTPDPKAATHPVLQEVEPFDAAGGLGGRTRPAADAVPLLWGQAADHRQPVAWTCQRAGRALTTCLGHPRDFWELDFLRLLRNGIAWSLEGQTGSPPHSSTAR